MFSKLFRGRKQETSTSSSEKLKQTLELLKEKEAVLKKKILVEIDRAKEYTKAKNKQAVLECMKRKKFYEGQMEQLGAFQSLIHSKEQRLSQTVHVHCRDDKKVQKQRRKCLNLKVSAVDSLVNCKFVG